MAQVGITVADNDFRWAEARVREGDFASLDHYVGDLVRRDRERGEAIARLQALVDEGRASPDLAGDPRDILREVMAGQRATRA